MKGELESEIPKRRYFHFFHPVNSRSIKVNLTKLRVSPQFARLIFTAPTLVPTSGVALIASHS